jgi:hypothetical protein
MPAGHAVPPVAAAAARSGDALTDREEEPCKLQTFLLTTRQSPG